MSQSQVQPAQDVSLDQTQNPATRKPRHRQWGAAVFLLLVSIAGLIGGRLGHLYPLFDVFAQFGMQFIALAVGCSLAMFLVRYKAIFGIGLTIALLAAYGAWPQVVSAKLQQPPYPLAAGEKVLRVAHFNTYKNNFDFAAIVAEVLRLDADVVSLVEMSDEKKRSVLTTLKAKYPFTYDCKGVFFCELAVISKYPIIETDANANWAGAPHIRATLGGAMAGVTVVAVHTTRFPHSRWQLLQVKELGKKLETISGELVIMGDFNATPFSRITASMEQGANVVRLTELPTWPSFIQLPQLAIDHIFASKGFRVVGNQQIGNSAGSDHYPILMTLALKREP